MLKKVLVPVVLLAVGVVAFLFLRDGGAQPEYKTAKVVRGDVTDSVSATGRVNPVVSVSVGTQISGAIKKIHVDYNDSVKKGQVLIELDREAYESRAAEAESALRARQAQHEKAKVEFLQRDSERKRIAGLFEKGYVSRNEYETADYAGEAAKASLDIAEADLKSAGAALEVARDNLGKTIIKSPVDGVVITRDVEEGQTVAASLQAPVLLTVGDLKKMQIEAAVDEADIGKAAVGQKARFYVDSYPDREFEGKVSKIYFSPTIQQNVVTYNVLVYVDNEDLALRPGMTATVTLVADERNGVLLVPNKALRVRMPGAGNESKGPSVWALEGGKPVNRPVKLGIGDEENTSIAEGLKEGDIVVVESPPQKNEGGTSRPRWVP